MQEANKPSEGAPPQAATPQSQSRRRFIQRLAKCAVAAPIILAVTLDLPRAHAY